MVYIYVEDEKEGLLLMNNAVDLYIGGTSLQVDTFCGIFNLIDHIQNLNLNPSDSVYYIYDNVPENTDLPGILQNAKGLVIQNNLQGQIRFLPILCCEYSILTAENIEFFCHRKFVKLVLKLKEYKISKTLTTDTKNEPAFTYLYDRARKDQERKLIKKKVEDGVTYTQNDIEKAVTVEKLCKKMLAEVFQNELRISDVFGDCWIKACCSHSERICGININSRLLSSAEKQQFLVDYTVYIKLLDKITSTEGIQLKSYTPLNMQDIYLVKSVMHLICLQNPNFKRNVQLCKSNLESYFADGYPKKMAKGMCKSDGFSNDEIDCAIKDTPYKK